MDFKDLIKQLGERVENLKNNMLTEEATKNALVMPFLTALGYDVFNPLEVLPEMTCDIGTKKGEKIDYAIMKDGHPIMLIECKHWEQDLNLHDNQLLRYYNVSKAKFGVLTNGIIYRFYTELDAPNKMDEKPFLEINLQDLKDTQIEELRKFHKSNFDVDTILTSASEMKYMSELKAVITGEFTTPSQEFVKFLCKQMYDGKLTAKLVEQFTVLVKRSINTYFNDLISDRLKAAIKKEEVEEPVMINKEKDIVTTEDELQAFNIIRAILCKKLDMSRITYRDAQTYFAVLLDDNNRKTICRLYFNGSKKHIKTLDADKKEIRHDIEDISDIYQFADEINKTVDLYESK